MNIQDAIKVIVGEEVAECYALACADWIERDPRTASMLGEDCRPRVVPAGVVPYGHKWLAWITGSDSLRPIIHVPTDNNFSNVRWHAGDLVEAEGANLRATFRHELGHWFQHQINTRPAYGLLAPSNTHAKQSWLRTIGVWHNVQHVEDFVQHLTGRAFADKEFLSALKSYPFPASAPDWVLAADKPFVPDQSLTKLTCVMCEAQFTARRGSQTCSAKCRVKLSRSKRSPEQIDAQRLKDAERIRDKRQAAA